MFLRLLSCECVGVGKGLGEKGVVGWVGGFEVVVSMHECTK